MKATTLFNLRLCIAILVLAIGSKLAFGQLVTYTLYLGPTSLAVGTTLRIQGQERNSEDSYVDTIDATLTILSSTQVKLVGGDTNTTGSYTYKRTSATQAAFTLTASYTDWEDGWSYMGEGSSTYILTFTDKQTGNSGTCTWSGIMEEEQVETNGNGYESYTITYNGSGTFALGDTGTTQEGTVLPKAKIIKIVETPQLSPAGKTISSSVGVTISCATSGAVIRYTTDGSDPTSNSKIYSGSVLISKTTTIKAKAFKDDDETYAYKDSAIASQTYTMTSDSGLSPTITSNPQGTVTALASKGAKLSVKLAKSKTKPTYQWLLNGVTIPGATKSSYTAKSDGIYSVSVTNSAGVITQEVATVKLITPPKIATFTSSVTNIVAGDSVTFKVTLQSSTGTAPLTYTWMLGGKAVAGAPNAATWTTTGIVKTGKYSVQITNGSGKAIGKAKSNAITIKVVEPVQITQQPMGLSLVAGKSGKLTVKATGTKKLTYQWYKDGVAISGATTATLSLKKVTAANAGSYTAKVNNPANRIVTSSSATVTVGASGASVQNTVATPSISPASKTTSSAVSVTISCSTSGATIRYTTNGNNPTSSSTVYTGAFTVSKTTTVKAKAFKSGMTDSAVSSQTYTFGGSSGTTNNQARIATIDAEIAANNKLIQKYQKIKSDTQALLSKTTSSVAKTSYNQTIATCTSEISKLQSRNLALSNEKIRLLK